MNVDDVKNNSILPRFHERNISMSSMMMMMIMMMRMTTTMMMMMMSMTTTTLHIARGSYYTKIDKRLARNRPVATKANTTCI